MRKFLVLLVTLALMMPTALAISTGAGSGISISTEQFKPLIWMCDSRVVSDDYVEPGRISMGGEELLERTQNYAFEGEQVAWNVLVMDKNGIEKVKDVYVTVDPTLPVGDGQTEPTILHKTQRFCGNIPFTTTTWTQNIVLPKFDPALGTLTGAEFELNTELRTNIQLEHLSTEGEADFTAIVEGSVNVSDGSGVLLHNPLYITRSGHVTAYDGTTDYAGSSGSTFSNITDSLSDTLPITNLVAYTATSPGQSFSLSVFSVSEFSLLSTGNYASVVRTDAAAEACINYNYDQVIPGTDGTPIEANCELDSPTYGCCTGDYWTLADLVAAGLNQGTGWTGDGCYTHVGLVFTPAGQPDCLPRACNARIEEEQLTTFDPSTMGMYHCALTVESPESMHGHYWIAANVVDLDDQIATFAENEYWFMNPTIALAISGTPLNFGTVRPGTQAYSNSITVGNGAELGSGVLLDMFISGTDFYDSGHSGAKCPVSNVLRLNNFAYYATNGAYSSQDDIRASSDPDGENYVPIAYGAAFNVPTPFYDNAEIIRTNPIGYSIGNILSPGSEMSVTFRLSLPEPCNGDFSAGKIFFWGEAI